LAPAFDAGGIEGATDDVVTNTWQVFYPATAHEHDGVLLQVVPFPADVGIHLLLVGEAHTGYLTKRGVRLLGSGGVHPETYAPALRTGVKCG